VEIIWEVPD